MINTQFSRIKIGFFVLATILLFSSACSKTEKPIPTVATDTPQAQFEQAIYCAALMGVYQQLVQQSVSQATKSAVGFTLGHASNINLDHELGKHIEQAFQQQTLKLYTQLDAQTITAKNSDFKHCVNEAKLYDPKTQIPALIEKSKKSQPQ